MNNDSPKDFSKLTPGNDTEKFLKSIDPMELTNRIKRFRSLNIKLLGDVQLTNEIYNTLCFNGVFECFPLIRTIPKDTPFFRVKKFVGSKVPDPRFTYSSDFWETPSKYLTTYGRLNKPHESLLYISPYDAHVPIKEMNVQENEFFALIKYISKKDIKFNFIGGDYDYKTIGLTDSKAILINEIYNNFFRDEFSRDVGKGTEYLYRVSEIIAKHFFNLPPSFQDAWAYVSVQDKTKCNMCFTPYKAHELLQLCGAMICKSPSIEPVKVYCIALDGSKDDKISYFHLGTPEQMKVFPEIVVPNN